MSENEPAADVNQVIEIENGAAEAAGGDPPRPEGEMAQGTAEMIEKEPDLEARMGRLAEEKKEISDRMLRLAADFENYKRRTRREMEEAGLRGMEALLREIFPVIDNLDRAIDAARNIDAQNTAAAALLDGVRLVQKQFLGALEKFQIKSFEAQGLPFDPQFHEAVQQIESDTLPPGTVAAVFQRGYMAGSRLLRPAMVAVVRGRPQAQASGDEGPGAQETAE